MSWPTWTTAGTAIPTAMAAPVQSTLLPTALNPAPAVLAPMGYSQDQWAQAQQQNWQQWAQWQQQYQQWHQQYGAEYQKSMSAMQGGLPTPSVQPPLPAAMAAAIAPPLPVENKPPLPPEEPPQPAVGLSYHTTAMPKAAPTGYTTGPPLMAQQSAVAAAAAYQPAGAAAAYQPAQNAYLQQTQTWPTSAAQKRPLGQEPDYDNAKKAMMDKTGAYWNQQKPAQNQWQNNAQTYSQPPPAVAAASKANVEELSEAEKKFDKEFAAWEAQFNKWKDQNVNHPDKTQYKEYEKKWESWRNSLLERREQMRRKRLALTGQTAPPTPAAKPQGFNQPPPGHQVPDAANSDPQPVQRQSLLGQYPGAGVDASQPDLFSKPPPTQNNEPLAFKNPAAEQESADTSGEGFLNPSSSSGGIPGLDLVKEDTQDENLPDNTDAEPEEAAVKPNAEALGGATKGPDFEAISKGINSILGDQKLLSMLSMVSQNAPSVPAGPVGPAVPAATNTTPVMPTGYGQQNFNVPPPTLQQLPSGNYGAPITGEPPNYPIQNFDKSVAPADYFQGQDQFGNFNQPNRFSAPPPNMKSNISAPQDDFNARPTEGRDTFSRSSGNFDRGGDNLNRNDRFNSNNSRFDDNYQGGRFDEYGSRGNSAPNNFNRNNSFSNQNKPYGHTDNFRKDDYDDYDNYDDDDYDKYNDMFKDDDDQGADDKRYQDKHYQDKQYQDQHYQDRQDRYQDQPYLDKPPYPGPQSQAPHLPPKKIPGLMDQIIEPLPKMLPSLLDQAAPAPPLIRPPIDEPLFEAATVIDYDHKPLLRECDQDVSVEPNNMYDYRHKPLNRIPLAQRPKWLVAAVKFIREFDPVALRFEKPPGLREEEPFKRSEGKERPFKDDYEKDRRRDRSYERDDYRRGRDDYRRDHRRSNSRDKSRFERKDFTRDRGRSRDDEKMHKQKSSDGRYRQSNEPSRTDRKGITKEDFEDFSDTDMDFEQSEQARHHQEFETRKSKSKSPELSNPPNPSSNQMEITMIEDIINAPGRLNRPPRIVIILRGPPGSGKTFLAKQIKDKEIDNGGSAPRILSLDDYFMVEQEKKVVEDGKTQTVKEMVYEYEAEMEESYRTSFMKSFKKTITDGYFPFIIVDNVNDKVKHFGEMWSFAKQNGFQVYICQMDLDPVQCAKRNIHNRSESEIEEIISGWEPTPSHHPTIDASGLLQTCAIAEVEMEVEEQQPEPTKANPESKQADPEDQVRSKWDTFDCSSNNLAKLDGVSKPLRKSRTMEEYLRSEIQWEPPKSTTTTPGKKRVRWADLEEQRELEKMRAIGFVVGHTDWNRMMDPTEGRRALTQTKYIEKVSRY